MENEGSFLKFGLICSALVIISKVDVDNST